MKVTRKNMKKINTRKKEKNIDSPEHEYEE